MGEESLSPRRIYASLKSVHAVDRGADCAGAAERDAPPQERRGRLRRDREAPLRGQSPAKTRTEETPKTGPEGAAFSPEPDPFAGGVKANEILFGEMSATDDAHLFHVDASVSQCLDGLFGLGVVGEAGNRNISAFHRKLLSKRWMSPSVSAA